VDEPYQRSHAGHGYTEDGCGGSNGWERS